jgi:hypothetical protein
MTLTILDPLTGEIVTIELPMRRSHPGRDQERLCELLDNIER